MYIANIGVDIVTLLKTLKMINYSNSEVIVIS